MDGDPTSPTTPQLSSTKSASPRLLDQVPLKRHAGKLVTSGGRAQRRRPADERFPPRCSTWGLREYLARYTACRQVSKEGRVWVYGHRCSVGRKHAGMEVGMYYDAGAGEWVFPEPSGAVFRRLQALEITRERIMGLHISS